MKLIVDISEEEYKYIKDIPKDYMSLAHKVIANGTPLDKFIDAVRAENNQCEEAELIRSLPSVTRHIVLHTTDGETWELTYGGQT